MAADYVPAALVERLRGSTGLGIFLRVDAEPAPLRVWMGVNDVPVGMESLDPDGTVYLGAGRVVHAENLEVLINGQASSATFTLSGLTAEHAQKVQAASPDVEGRDVHVGIMALDDRHQPIASVLPLWTGLSEYWALEQPMVTGTEEPERRIMLSVATGEVGRSRASRVKWTHTQQLALAAGDQFCRNTALYARGVDPAWPRF